MRREDGDFGGDRGGDSGADCGDCGCNCTEDGDDDWDEVRGRAETFEEFREGARVLKVDSFFSLAMKLLNMSLWSDVICLQASPRIFCTEAACSWPSIDTCTAYEKKKTSNVTRYG
eukprot:TRINITY_DN621_c0_g1_i9.p3 TRINITY_DN621_c0_g1~~TRINITY_DN621_c0_g1_i9.p3  ORF type:complete len:116 (-),score=8.20 TRINITY_DN621_c0_g1_i9:283-630(-)